MSVLSKAMSFWRNLIRRERKQKALDEELSAYVNLVADQYEGEGMTRETARRRARAETHVEHAKELTRDAWSGAWLERSIREVRHTARSLERAPLFAVTVVLTLGIAIGSATALFTIIKGSLLRSLPAVADPGGLVSVEPVRGSTVLYDFSYPDFVDFRDQTTTLSSLALYDGTSVAWRDSLDTGHAWMSYVSGEFFATLGVHAVAGRLLTPSDITPQAPNPVIVIGYDFWQRHFNGARNAVGATIRLNDYPLTVVGVAPAGFVGAMALHRMELWVPLTTMQAIFHSALTVPSRSDASGRLVARLAPGRTVNDAHLDLAMIASRLAAAYPEDQGRGVLVYAGAGMTRDERTELRRLPMVLLGAVVLLLLVACANAASLSLVRSRARTRELATRLALGASRASLATALLLESGALAGAAAALGTMLARLLVDWNAAVEGVVGMPDVDLRLDWRVFAVSIGCAALTMVLVSIAPLRATMSVPVGAVLKDGTAGASRRRSRGQRVLVAAQVAATLTLLLSGAVVFSSAQRALAADPGFDAKGVTTAFLTPFDVGLDSARQGAFYRDVLQRAQAHPALEYAGLATIEVPAPWAHPSAVYRDGDAPPSGNLKDPALGPRFDVFTDRVSPGTLEALYVPLVAGRRFISADDEHARHVAVVSKLMADALWPGENAIGKVVAWPNQRAKRVDRLTVVGVVADVRFAGLTNGLVPAMYVPLAQHGAWGNLSLVMRGRGGASVSDTVLREIVHAAAPTLNVAAEPLAPRMAEELTPQRRASAFIGAFSVVTLLLATIGLYGVVAQGVQQRTRELAVRAAVGGSPGALLRMILGDGVSLTLVGIAFGTVAAMLSVRVLRSMYAGLDAIDPTACGVALAVLIAAALAASYVPARRAANLNVMDALRVD